MCDISVQFSSPIGRSVGVFSPPHVATRPHSSNPFTPIRNLFFSKRDPDSSAGTGAATLGKRQRAKSDEPQSPIASNSNSLLDSSPPPPPASPPLNSYRPRPPMLSTPPSSPASSSFSSPSHLSSSPSTILSSPSVARVIPPPPPPTPIRRSRSNSRARVALQTPDEMHNAIVITALEEVPFCCHEDLLTMSRDQLIVVAISLNQKLPKVMRIDVGENRSDGFIRKSIEILVGISKPDETGSGTGTGAVEPPGAPKAVKSRPMNVILKARQEQAQPRVRARRLLVHNDEMNIDSSTTSLSLKPNPSTPKSDSNHWLLQAQSSPAGIMSSPLAAKRASRSSSSSARTSFAYDLASVGTPRLARLEEAEEEELATASSSVSLSTSVPAGDKDEESKRGKKRRRISESISGSPRSGSQSKRPSGSFSRIRRSSGSFGRSKKRARASGSDLGSSSPLAASSLAHEDIEMTFDTDIDSRNINTDYKFRLPDHDVDSNSDSYSFSNTSPSPLHFISASSPAPSRLGASSSTSNNRIVRTGTRTRMRSRSMSMAQDMDVSTATQRTPRTRVHDALRKLALGRSASVGVGECLLE